MRRKARKPSKDNWAYYWNPREHLSARQLEAIGSIIMAWNYIEAAVDNSLANSLMINTKVILDVTSRINGFDGKVAIIKSGLEADSNFSDDDRRLFADTLGALEEHKRYRDGVAHALGPNPKTFISITSQRKGIEDEILLTQEALDALLGRLIILGMESLVMASAIISSRVSTMTSVRGIVDEARETLSKAQSYSAQLRDQQKHRKGLPPLPQFPEEPPTLPASEEPQSPQD